MSQHEINCAETFPKTFKSQNDLSSAEFLYDSGKLWAKSS